MIKKLVSLLLKTKPLIISLLEKIEKLENSSNVKRTSNLNLPKISLPEWVLSLLFIIMFIFVYFFIQPFVFVLSALFVFIEILVLLIFIYLVWYSVKHFVEKLRESFFMNVDDYKENIVIFWTVIMLTVFLGFILRIFNFRSFYILPLFGFSLIVALLTNELWAGIYAILASVILGWLFGWSFESFIFYVLTSLYVTKHAKKIFSRKDIFNTIAKATVMNIGIAFCLSFVIKHKLEFVISEDILIGNVTLFNILFDNIVSGLIAVTTITILLGPMESLYRKTTNIKLMELANFNHPLLKLLVTQAPGTYHHSMIVSTLSEQAAVELKANALLCKVASYYHDIGKITNPEYFIENQFSLPNPHRELNPSISSLVIINHVKEGINLAKKYKLDKVIIDIIQQHHGDAVIHGIYEKTLQLGIEGIESSLRYPGPKPKTKEAVIVMIADSCEAACRSISEPDVAKIKDTVESVINSKFVEGQFDDSPITLRDLYKIANIMIHMLTSFYHLRTHQDNGK